MSIVIFRSNEGKSHMCDVVEIEIGMKGGSR